MRVLFAGDSITKGEYGSDYVSMISILQSDDQVVNIAKNGLTYNLIIKSVLEFLRNDNAFDYLVLQGGYNDLLLPVFDERGGLFRFAYKSQLKKGHRPFDTSKHVFTYLDHSVAEIRELFSGKIILVNIGCLGEDLSTDLNKKVAEFNNILAQIADRQKVELADTNRLFAKFLSAKTVSGYCVENFWALTVVDRLTGWLARRRKLHLTTDGVHLNNAGAKLFAEAVATAISQEVLP